MGGKSVIGWAVATGLLSAVLASGSVLAAEGDRLPQLAEFPDGPNPGRLPAIPDFEDGKGLFWTSQDMAKAFVGRDKGVHIAGAYGGTKEYTIWVNQRPPKGDAEADAEMHQNMTQIYIVLSGTGTQYLGGEPAKATSHRAGNFTAKGLLKGARKFRIGPGDMILIPPATWHTTVPDPGQTLNYNMVNVMTPRPDSAKP